MTGFIGMKFAEVEDLANALSGGAQQNLDDLSRLATRADPSDVWQGDAAEGYRQAFERWSNAQKEAQAALDGLSKAVNVVKQHFQVINDDGQAAFASFYQ